MKVEQVIRERRSIRRYREKMPEDEKLEKILAAAVWAPSGLNNQPWKFKLIRDARQKQALSGFTKYGRIIRDAPMAICVFLDKGASYNREKDIQSVGACIQNMLLQAWELGLASCWLGEILNRRKQVENYLKTGSDYELMAVVTLGYAAEKITKGCRKKLNAFLL